MASRAGRKNETVAAARVLTLFEYLRQHGFFDKPDSLDDPLPTLPFEDAEKHFGWSRKELIGLAEELACCGQCQYLSVPLYVDVENDRLVSTGTFSALRKPVRLSSAECTALTTALDLAGIGKDDPLCVKLLENVANAGDQEIPWDDQVLASTENSERIGSLLLLLADAIGNRHPVRIVYLKQGSMVPTERVVEPIVFTLESGKWYLHAYCRLREDVRVFSLLGIRKASVEDEIFIPRDAEIKSFSSMLEQGFPNARLRIDARMQIEPRDWPGLVVKSTEDDGSRIVTIPYLRSLWLPTRIAARFGEIVVLEPAYLGEVVADLAHARLEEARAAQVEWDDLVSKGDAGYWERHLQGEPVADSAKEALVETLVHTTS